MGPRNRRPRSPYRGQSVAIDRQSDQCPDRSNVSRVISPFPFQLRPVVQGLRTFVVYRRRPAKIFSPVVGGGDA